MREEFQQRRGYDPSPYLLALTGRAASDGPTTDRFLWDFRRTISDLFADNYFGYMAGWWEPGRAWLQYIARSQFLLQSGEFGAAVLCFAGNAAPNGTVTRNDLTAAGYDACGTDILAALTVDRGDVVLPCGKRYRLLVLPDHPFHTPAFAIFPAPPPTRSAATCRRTT